MSYFPKTGEKININNMVTGLMNKVGASEKVAAEIAEALDLQDQEGADGKITVGFTQNDIEKVVLSKICKNEKWCDSTLWKDVNQVKSTLVNLLVDDRAENTITAEKFVETLLQNAQEAGVNLTDKDAREIATVLVNADGRLDGKINYRYTGNQLNNFKAFVESEFALRMNPDSFVFLAPQYPQADREKIARVMVKTLDSSPELPFPQTPLLAQIEETPNFQMAGMISPELWPNFEMAILSIENFLAHPNFSRTPTPEERQWAITQAQGILVNLKKLRDTLYNVETAYAQNCNGNPRLLEGFRKPEITNALRQINSNLSQYLFHLQNNISHDLGRNFLAGIEEGTSEFNVRSTLELGRVGWSKTSEIGQAVRSGASQTPAVVEKLREVSAQTQQSPLRPLAIGLAVAAGVIVIGASAWYLWSQSQEEN